MKLNAFRLLTAGLLCVTTTGFAQAPAALPPAPPAPVPALVAGTPVVVDFAPPLGKTMRYRYSQTTEREGKPSQSTVDFVVRFERLGAGYRFITRADVPAPKALKNHPSVKLLENPLVFRVDEDGSITGIDDEPGYWAMVERLTADLIKASSVDGPAAKIMRDVQLQMKQMPHDARVELISRNLAPILQMARVSLDVGESTTSSEASAAAIPLLGGKPVRRNTTVKLVSASGGIARLAITSEIDAEDMKGMLTAIMKIAPADKRAPTPPAMSNRTEISYAVSIATGLTRSFKEDVIIETQENGKPRRAVKTRTMELVPGG